MIASESVSSNFPWLSLQPSEIMFHSCVSWSYKHINGHRHLWTLGCRASFSHTHSRRWIFTSKLPRIIFFKVGGCSESWWISMVMITLCGYVSHLLMCSLKQSLLMPGDHLAIISQGQGLKSYCLSCGGGHSWRDWWGRKGDWVELEESLTGQRFKIHSSFCQSDSWNSPGSHSWQMWLMCHAPVNQNVQVSPERSLHFHSEVSQRKCYWSGGNYAAQNKIQSCRWSEIMRRLTDIWHQTFVSG